MQGRLTSKQYPDTSTVTFTYETTTSRLKSVTDALSQVKTYAYDDRLSGVTYTGAVNPRPDHESPLRRRRQIQITRLPHGCA